MRHAYRLTLLLLLTVALPRPSAAQALHHGCPMQGDARSTHVRALDRLKNGDTAPKTIDCSITLAAMLAPGDDTHRWRDDRDATIAGYVYNVKPGGLETVNCHAPDLKYRRKRIEFVLFPMAEGSQQRVVVEVTPRWRAKMAAQDVDWSTRTLRRELKGR